MVHCNHVGGAQVKARIVRIGNSQGVRIPKVLLEETGLADEVEIVPEGNRLVIRPARRPREGWASAFKAMHDAGDDVLLDGYVPTEFDEEEWDW